MQKSGINTRTNGLLEEPVLVRLLPDQVSDRWIKFAEMLGASLPPVTRHNQEAMVNILKSILKGKLVCWAYVSDDTLKALISTTVRIEPISGSRDLLIYTFTTIEGTLDWEDWKFILTKLRNYASGNRCQSIMAYTINPKVADFLKRQGARVDNILIQMEV